MNPSSADDSGVESNGSISGPQQTISGPTSGLQQTILSFVLRNEEEKDDKEEARAVVYERVKGLSNLYAILIILVGVAFPVAEALIQRWLTHEVVGVFMTYLFVVASMFLLLLHFFILPKSKETKVQESFEQESETEAQTKSCDVIIRRSSLSVENLQVPRSSSSDMLTTFGEGMARRLSSSSLLEKKLMQRKSSGEDIVALNSSIRKPLDVRIGDESVSKRVGTGLAALKEESNVTSDDSFIEPDPRKRSDIPDGSIDSDEVMEYIRLSNTTATISSEGSSFFLRLGAMMFGLGALVFDGFQLEMYWGGHVPSACKNQPLLWPVVFHIIFIMVQIFFIFKHCQIHVNCRYKPLVRMGLMHVMATNMCVWIRMVARETMEGASHSHHSLPHDFPELTAKAAGNGTLDCSGDDTLLRQASPYLFPCVLEYSLIAVAVMISMSSEIDIRYTDVLVETVQKMIGRWRRTSQEEEEEEKKSHVINAEESNLHKSHMGLFIGMLVLAVTTVSIALFFYARRTDKARASVIFQSSDIAFQSLLIIAVTTGLFKFRRLGMSFDRNNTIDGVLIILGMSGLILYELFIVLSMATAITLGNKGLVENLTLVAAFFDIFLAVWQTIFILNALTRFSKTKEQRHEKPGRGVVTFLVVANVAMWAFKTFQVKQAEPQLVGSFYGKLAWNLVMHLCLPLMLFFHFHSSVCYAHIWHSAYEPEHVMHHHAHHN